MALWVALSPTFVAKTDGDTLKFYIGDGANDRVEIHLSPKRARQTNLQGWAWSASTGVEYFEISDTPSKYVFQ